MIPPLSHNSITSMNPPLLIAPHIPQNNLLGHSAARSSLGHLLIGQLAAFVQFRRLHFAIGLVLGLGVRTTTTGNALGFVDADAALHHPFCFGDGHGARGGGCVGVVGGGGCAAHGSCGCVLEREDNLLWYSSVATKELGIRKKDTSLGLLTG